MVFLKQATRLIRAGDLALLETEKLVTIFFAMIGALGLPLLD